MKSGTGASRLGIFVAFSVALHVAAAAALYFLVPEERGLLPEGAYVVNIVPPEPTPLPQPLTENVPEMARPGPTVRRKAPLEPGPPPKELSARATLPKEPKGAEKAGEPPAAAPPDTSKEAVSEVPGFEPKPKETEERELVRKEGAEGEGLGERLFDPEVLAGVIEKGRESKAPESSVTFDTREMRSWGYMQRLKERIEYVWEYPPEAAAKGIYGDLVIRFVIKQDGALGSVELVRTSGWSDLDKAAIRALKDGAPYWPIPMEWDTNSLTVTGHFIYSTHGNYYIR